MKRSAYILSFLLITGLATASVFAGGQRDEPKKDDTMMKSDDTMMKEDDAMMSDDGMSSDDSMMHDDSTMEKDDSMMMSDDSMIKMDDGMMSMSGMGTVVTYTDLQTAGKHVKDGPTVLFFSATWCPDCQATMKELNEKLSTLSKDITVVVVDYDTYGDLKTKYGITYQHTFVQIDASGNRKAIWSGGGIAEINRRVVRG